MAELHVNCFFLPVNACFACECEAVFPCLRWTEDQVNVHALWRQQSAKTIIRLDVNKLKRKKNTYLCMYLYISKASESHNQILIFTSFFFWLRFDLYNFFRCSLNLSTVEPNSDVYLLCLVLTLIHLGKITYTYIQYTHICIYTCIYYQSKVLNSKIFHVF